MDLTQLSSNLKAKTDFNAGSTLGLRDINSVVGVVDNSVTSLQALIFSNKNPKYDDIDVTNFDKTGITAGNQVFIFDIKKEYKFNLSSEITDHYVEDNLAIQDQVGLKPEILEVTGSIGEVDLASRTTKFKSQNENRIANEIGMNNEKGNIFNSIDSYLGRMGSLTSFAPNIVNQAMDIYNTAKFGYATATKFMNFNKEQGNGKSGQAYTEEYNEKEIKKTKQFNQITWFRQKWEQRASFSIVTPYGVLNNMYIMDLVASQPESTRYVTNLTIKFKHIRKAVTGTDPKKTSEIMETQLGKITDFNGYIQTSLPVEETGVIIREKEDGTISIDATPDKLNSIRNSNNTFDSEILGTRTTDQVVNVNGDIENITTDAVKTSLDSYKIDINSYKAGQTQG